MRFLKFLVESISLSPFDREVFNSIEGKEHMFLREKEGTYYTFKDGNEDIGIVGFNNGTDIPFLQIGIIKKHRGKGFLVKAYNMLAKKHNFKKVYVDIEQSNKKSIESHRDFGFKELPKIESVDKRYYPTDVRLYKKI